MMRYRHPFQRNFFLGVLGILGVVLGLGLLSAALPASPPKASKPPKPRVLFIGVDAATWKVIGPLIAKGELPTFARLAREGAGMHEFGTLSTTLSPIVWTSVATGRAPEDHGVLSFTSELPNGQKIPVSSRVRKARAIWEVATRRGMSVGVVGWWASWPAEAVNGYVVTDHANPAFSSFLFADRNYWTADRAALSRLEKDFLPLAIAPVLARHWISQKAFPYADLQRRGRFTPRQMETLRATPLEERSPYSLLRTFYSVDYPLFAATKDLMHARPTDLVMLYLRGPDPVQHYAWDLVEPERYAVPPENLERDRGLVQGVYRYVDTFLAELLASVGPETWVIVASDHGSEPAPSAMGNPRVGRPGEHSSAAKGVLFLRGPHVKPGYVIQGADPLSLMPTICWLLGLPLSDELPGKPLTTAFDDAWARTRPVLHVPTYGPRETQPLLASEADRKMIESLKSLGYIQ